jgi:hypothetical protein
MRGLGRGAAGREGLAAAPVSAAGAVCVWVVGPAALTLPLARVFLGDLCGPDVSEAPLAACSVVPSFGRAVLRRTCLFRCSFGATVWRCVDAIAGGSPLGGTDAAAAFCSDSERFGARGSDGAAGPSTVRFGALLLGDFPFGDFPFGDGPFAVTFLRR